MRDTDHPDTAHVNLRSLAHETRGAVWAHAGTELNATLLSWPAEHTIATHVNDACEVLIVGVSGEGLVIVDEVEHQLYESAMVTVPRDAERTIRAGNIGLAYLSIHRAREPLALRPHLGHPKH